jgi:glycogen operon protein
MLMISQGVPMVLMGDEVARSQQGNNNAYCHDNELNWFDWTLIEKKTGLLRFFKNVIAFRHAHPALRNRWHFSNRDYMGSGYADISWHGVEAWNADWSEGSRVLAFMLCGKHAKNGTAHDNHIYVAVNMYWDALPFQLPRLPLGMRWHMSVNTSMPSPEDIHEPGQEALLGDQTHVLVGGRSVIVLVGK